MNRPKKILQLKNTTQTQSHLFLRNRTRGSNIYILSYLL